MEPNVAPIPESELLETRELWWNIHNPYSKEVFYAMAIIGVGIFIYGMSKKLLKWSNGKLCKNDCRFTHIKERVLSLLSFGLLQKKVHIPTMPGISHALVFFGFITLWIVTQIVGIQDHDFLGIYFLQGSFYKVLSFCADIAGLAVLIGVIMFTLRRYVFVSKSLDNRQLDWLQLVFLAFFIITGFLIEGIRMSATNNIEAYAPVGALVQSFVQFMTQEDLLARHQALWWMHSFATFAFIALIPYTKFLHIFTAPLNTFLFTKRAKGELRTPYKLMEIMEAEAEGKEFDEEELNIGINSFEDFTWKTLLDSDACTACGRCHVVCPATNTQKPLSPKHLMLDIKALASAPKESQDNVYATIETDVLWSCTSCRACMEECPVMVEHVDTIVDMRRGLLAQNKAPSSLQTTLKNLRTKFNPWGLNPSDRERWIQELKEEEISVPTVKEKKDFEYLYWVGSPGAYDARNIKVTKANAKMFLKAGLNFAVLGNEEKTTGDIARRAGDEGLFQELAIENIEILQRYGVKKIITQCPHAFNTFKNEYPELGLEGVEVYHHSEILAELLDENKLTPKNTLNETVTYHDPCYLGRYNDIYDPPRYILENIPGITIKSVDKEKKKSTCCGGGGAQIWYEMPGTQINSMRFEELNEHAPEKINTSCPYCSIMISTATTNVFPGTNIPEIEDIAVTLSKAVL